MIRNVTPADAEAIARIYNHYIVNTSATFEEDPVSVEEMRARIVEISSSLPWLVYEQDGAIVGYTYASKWKNRSAYRHSVESTIFLDSAQVGKGIGTQLYQQLLAELKAKSYHSVIGGVAILNTASVALHEKMGYKKVAHFEQVGWKFGKWIDVGYWQRILE